MSFLLFILVTYFGNDASSHLCTFNRLSAHFLRLCSAIVLLDINNNWAHKAIYL